MAIHRTLMCSVLTAGLAVTGAVFAGPAAAAPGLSSGHDTFLTITTARGERPLPPEKVATLTCTPTGGNHPHRAAACRDLRKANGDPSALPGDPNSQICTMDYRPVSVTLSGKWQGRKVHFSQTYPNACVLKGETGPVFLL